MRSPHSHSDKARIPGRRHYQPVIQHIGLAELSLGKSSPFFFAGRLEELPSHFAEYSSPHRHDYYAVFFFRNGAGQHMIDFEAHRVKPDTVFFLKPGEVHSWIIEPGFTGFAVKISRDFCSLVVGRNQLSQDFAFFDMAPTRATLQLNAEQSAALANDMERLAVAHNNETKPAFLYALSEVIFHSLAHIYDHESPRVVERSLLHAVFQQIEDRFRDERSPRYYARSLGVSLAKLNSICNAEIGKTAGRIIQDRIVLEAKRLLAHSPMNIQQIARDLKFSDSAYFSRFFKRHCGKSPEYFRQSAQKIQ